ncbi:MAG TPA: amidase [Caldimonas sp.]|nr:amidase [Caldimonas sp.]HEX4234455.1 amidase [Caldimonas sp.]
MTMLRDAARAFMPYPDAPVAHAPRGPLAGLTFAVKDLFDVAGYPTSGGQPFVLAMSGIKTTTAPTVQRLLDVGARFVGKTITDELAFSMNGQNVHFGSPVNGAAPDRISGGSSSGSASAVSNGLCDFALGSDTGGSVRAPASHCALVGLRPTHGRISLERVLDLSPSFDTCGWFARDVATFARVADSLLGADVAPLPADRVRLLAPSDVWALLAAEPLEALRAPRARVEDALGPAAPVEVVLDDFETMFWSFRFLQGREAWRTDGALIERFAPPLGAGIKERFAWSREVTDAQVAAAAAFRERFRARMTQLLGNDGVLLMPTMPDVAPLVTADDSALEDYRARSTQMLCIAGLAGCPQLTLPLGSRLGAPLGISLLGPAGSDRSLVRLAERIAGASR